jgi:uncharacterized short protein YbdD (DUF466 family)
MSTMAGSRLFERTAAARLRGVGRALGRFARLCVGVPSYEHYLAHRRSAHPGEPVLSYAEFCRDRLEARYARGAQRCC